MTSQTIDSEYERTRQEALGIGEVTRAYLSDALTHLGRGEVPTVRVGELAARFDGLVEALHILRQVSHRVQRREARKAEGYCEACQAAEHDTCSMTAGCPCCADSMRDTA